MTASDWPASTIERRVVSDLIPYARNARTHSPEQVAEIAASIRRFGWTSPALIAEDGTIIAGHGRVMAAQLLGITEIPVMVARGWSDAERRAYTLADNKIALNAGWDDDLLKIEVGELIADGVELLGIGFSQQDIDTILVEIPEASEDDMDAAQPSIPVAPVSRAGDVWRLGAHRILCGDSTDAAAVARILDGDRAALLFTSPPYSNQREYMTGGISDWDLLMRGVFANADAALDPGGQILVNLGLVHSDAEWHPYWTAWVEWMRSAGWRRFGWYVWDQGPGLMGDWGGRFAPAFEFIFHFNKTTRKPNKIIEAKTAGQIAKKGGLRGKDGVVQPRTGAGKPIQSHKIPDSVVRINRHSGAIEAGSHPAVFAVKLPIFIMESYTDIGDVVFEPFCGSGTTVLAAEKTGRVARAIELAPEYVDVAVQRWNAVFPDRPATIAETGETIEAAAASRSAS